MTVSNVGVSSQYPQGVPNFNCDVKGIVPEKKSGVAAGIVSAAIGTGVVGGGLYYLGEKESVKLLNEYLKKNASTIDANADKIIRYTLRNKDILSFTRYGNEYAASIHHSGIGKASIYWAKVGEAFKANWKNSVKAGAVFGIIGALTYLGIKALFTKNN